MDNDTKRTLIADLHKKGFRQCNIIKKLEEWDIKRLLVYRTIKRLQKTGNHQLKRTWKQKRIVRKPQLIARIKAKIKYNPQRSARLIAREVRTSHTTILRLIHKDLKFKCFKKQVVHGLTRKNKTDSAEGCKALTNKHSNSTILFSDEKLFV